MPEFGSFVGQKPSGDHRRIDCGSTENVGDHGLDRFELSGTDILAVKPFPNFDDEIVLVA
jgi:hypothetical protein